MPTESTSTEPSEPPAQPQGTPPGKAKNAGQGLLTAVSENPFKTWFATLPIAAGAAWAAIGFDDAPVKVADEEPLLMGLAGIIWTVGGVLAWQSSHARLTRQRRSAAFATIVSSAFAVGVAIIAAGLAQDPSSANLRTDDPITGAGMMKVTATGEHLRDKQFLMIRADWDGKPGYEYEQRLHREGSTATGTFTAGPVLSARTLRAIAYVHGAGDHPPDALGCGDYGPCAALTAMLPGAKSPNAKVRLHGRKLTIAVVRRKRAPGQVYLVVFQGRGPRLITKRAVRIESAAKTETVHVPSGVKTVCVVVTFDIAATGKCTKSAAAATDVLTVSGPGRS